MVNKLLCALFAVVAAGSLTACEQSNKQNPPAAQSSPPSTAATEQPVNKENTRPTEPHNGQPAETNRTAEKNTNADELESSPANILKDAEIISKGLWTLDDGIAKELDLATPATVVFTAPKKSDKGYGGEMQISSFGTRMPAIAKYIITAKNKIVITDADMVLSKDKSDRSAAYEISDGGKVLKIDFASGGKLYLTEDK